MIGKALPLVARWQRRAKSKGSRRQIRVAEAEVDWVSRAKTSQSQIALLRISRFTAASEVWIVVRMDSMVVASDCPMSSAAKSKERKVQIGNYQSIRCIG